MNWHRVSPPRLIEGAERIDWNALEAASIAQIEIRKERAREQIISEFALWQSQEAPVIYNPTTSRPRASDSL